MELASRHESNRIKALRMVRNDMFSITKDHRTWRTGYSSAMMLK